MGNQIKRSEQGRTLNQLSTKPDPPSTPSDSSKPHHPRDRVADLVTEFQKVAGQTSIRQYAKEHGIPPETVRSWVKRHDELGVSPDMRNFFESPAGLAFLHTMQIALHVCFTKMGTAGIRNISSFLKYTGLDQFLAASVGTQHAVGQQINERIAAFGKQETQRLAAQMPRRLIAVAEDETFHPDRMCLVIIEPLSNDILLECYAQKRDSKTWTQLVNQALDLKCAIRVDEIG